MKVALMIALLFSASNPWAGDPAPQKLDLGKTKVGTVPAGWKSGVTGKADGSVWKVVEDKTAPGGSLAFAQTTTNPGPIFNVCIAEGAKYKDVDISVAYKAMGGKGDQGGGIMWRVKDKDNYYVVRMNPLEENFRFYTVTDGKRKQLANADVKADGDKWHTIRVVHKGNKIQCYLNGKLLVDMTDDTFKDSGLVGLWTKADAVTHFAEFQITAKKE